MMFVDPVACLRSVCNRIDAKSHEINVSDENVENSMFLDTLPPTFGAMIFMNLGGVWKTRICGDFGVDQGLRTEN